MLGPNGRWGRPSRDVRVLGVANQAIRPIGETTLEVSYSGVSVLLKNVLVMDSCPVPLILGVDWIIQAEVTIEGEDGRLVARRRRKCQCVEEPCSSGVSPPAVSTEVQEDVGLSNE